MELIQRSFRIGIHLLGRHGLMRRFGWERWLVGGVLIAAASGIGWVGYQETQTSWLQAGVLTKYGEKLTYRAEPGPSEFIKYPTQGPYNEWLGYTEIPKALKGQS